MPIYVYQCACGFQEEIVHGMSEKLTPICLECSGQMVRRPAVGAVTFNGSGWGKDS